MIKPGQKLKEGDFVKDVTKEQFDELIAIENDEVKLDFEEGLGIACQSWLDSDMLTYAFDDLIKTEYDFPDFKQLCENTFGV